MVCHSISLFSAVCAGAITATALANPPQVDFKIDTFTSGFNLFFMGDEPGSLALANFFGDPTKPFSLVTGNRGVTPVNGQSGKLGVRLSFDGQMFAPLDFLTPAAPPTTTFNMNKVIAADLDGDFEDDLVILNSLAPPALFVDLHDTFVLNPNDPLNSIQSFSRVYPFGTFVGNAPEDVVVGDINGDSLLDIVVASPSDGRIEVLIYHAIPGDLYPQSFRITNSSVAGPRRLALKDVTGDSVPDLVVADASTGTVKVMAGDGAGNFAIIGSVNISATELALGDLDNDGDLDLIVDPGGTGFITALFNDGVGAFSAPLTLDVPSAGCEILIGDFNNDGRNDISVCGAGGLDAVTVAINNVAGGFFPKADFNLGVHGPNPKSIKAADFNQDGQLDIAVTVGTTSSSNPEPNVLILFNQTASILIGDLNGDGVVDGTDLATLLIAWGNCPRPPTTCPADLNCDGIVDGVDLAILLVNWNNPPPAMAQPGGRSGDALTNDGLANDPGAGGPGQAANAPNVPWVLAYFGFTSVDSYMSWLNLLTNDELADHIVEVLELLQNH